MCKACSSAKVKAWKKANPERTKASQQKCRRQGREEVLRHYGGSCACCGETRFEFLAIDHIDGGGNKHAQREGFTRLWAWLKANGLPKGFRVLCHNCNSARGFYGSCPHQGLIDFQPLIESHYSEYL